MTASKTARRAAADHALLPLSGVVAAARGGSRAVRLLEGLLSAQGATVTRIPRSATIASHGDLLTRTDVVIDSEPSAEQFGQRAIHCVLPSFSSLDPRLNRTRASDELLAAMTGAYFRDQHGGLQLSKVPVSACFAAFAGAIGIVAALLARERDGLGQTVEIPEFDATFLAAGVRALLVNGRPGAERPSDPWGGPFRCKDGRYVWMNLATEKAIHRFAEEVGRHREWMHEGFFGRADLTALSPSRHELRRRLEHVFLERSASDWDELAVRAGLAITAVRSLDDLGADADLDAGLRDGVVVEVEPINATQTAERERETTVEGGMPPHTAVSGAAPLTGTTVVDVSQMLAGPLAGRMLADLGATVVKINDPDESGAGFRWQENRYHTDVNRGKSTILLDLTTADGRRLGDRLIASADVLIENMRTDAAARLGIDEAHLRQVAPGICHAHISAFSLPSRWDAPGYEPNGQAIGAMMVADADTGVPRLQPLPLNDYGTGMLCAFGILLALLRRRRDGDGSYVRTSLSRTAFFYTRAALERQHEDDRDFADTNPAVRGHPVRVRNGWVVVDAARRLLLARLAEWSGTAAGSLGAGVPAEISFDGDAEELLSACEEAGLTASQLDLCANQARRDDLAERGATSRHSYDESYVVTAAGNPIRFSRTPVRFGQWVSRPGKDGPDILGQIEVTMDEQARLLEAGVLAFG